MIILKEEERNILEEISSRNVQKNQEGFIKLLGLSDYRRYITAYVIKKNSESFE